MSGISFMGSYSGIDRSTVDQLMEIERLPLKQFATKKTSITEQQGAWKDVNTRLNNLFEKIKTLQSSSTFTSRKATSTNEDTVSMSAGTSAVTGTYKINVSQLATSVSMIGNKVSEVTTGNEERTLDDKGKFIKSGSFIIKNHENIEKNENGREIKYDVKEDLNTLVKRINSYTKDQVDPATNKTIKGSGTGVTASIIDGRLVLTDDKTGNRNIELSDGIDENGAGTVERLGLNVAVKNGQDAEFTINNVLVTNPSNSITNSVVEGITINLKQEGDATITVGLDNGKAETAIKEFVDQYNSTMQFIEDKLAAGDPEIPGSKGSLAGDSSLMRLHSSLRSMVTSMVSKEKGEINDISQLGVSTIDRYGKLQFDPSKLNKAIEENPEKLEKFFDGFVSKVNGQIDSFISKENGIIKTKNETFDKTLKDIARQIETFEARMVKKEEQLIKQFTALDVAMMQAESQMTWLQGQVDAMNGIKR